MKAKTFFASLNLALVLSTASAWAQGAPSFNDRTASSDTVEQPAATLKFFDALSANATAQNNLDFQRGVEILLNFTPATSIEAIRRAMVQLDATNANRLVIFDELTNSDPLSLTGNTNTVYLSGMLDLGKDGPTVVEIPPGCGPGTVNDAFFRFVVDVGAQGSDKGKGGKYLILTPEYTPGTA